MMQALASRRDFLRLSLALVLAPAARALARPAARRTAYDVRARLLYGALRYQLAGTIDEQIDRAAGTYDVALDGQGTSFANRAESSGVLRGGRWVPLHSATRVNVAGREGRLDIAYDWERGLARYRSRSETFFLGRLRVVDDLVPMPSGTHIDDVVSAVLNHADGRWPPGPGGDLETRMVRRRRDRQEQDDEVDGTHRAELVPIRLEIVQASADGKRTALLDLMRFSTWALADQPARVVLGPDGRPETITGRLMYGTTFTIRFTPAAS
jgi:hypothetical protein